MATPAQIAANRRNARKSTGPKSVSGKLKSSRNSRRHGLNSKLPQGEVLAMYEEIIGRKYDLQELSVNLVTMTGNLEEDDDEFVLSWKH